MVGLRLRSEMEIPQEIRKDMEIFRMELSRDPFGDSTEALERILIWMFPYGSNERYHAFCDEMCFDLKGARHKE